MLSLLNPLNRVLDPLNLIYSSLNFIYPSRCPVCGERSDAFSTSPICRRCWSGIKQHEGPSCRICLEPFASEHATLCGRCLKERPLFTRALNCGLYTGALKEAIHLLKFSSIKRLAKPLGMLLSGLCLNGGLTGCPPCPEISSIVPVPLSLQGLRQRGFNQTVLIGRVVSKALGIPLLARLLYKKKDTPPQVGLFARERARNLRGAFGIISTGGKLKGERVLLLDDVMTTGATARECSKTLLKAGAEEVFVATIARSHRFF